MKKELLIIVFFVCVAFANGQIIDTVNVEEVVVTGTSISRFQAGSKIEKVPEQQFELMQGGNLDQLILRFTPFAIKSTAGSLATIRVRGTSPDHTSINFGGININSMTLGSSNLSNVPLYLFDEIGLQYGSASVVNGSGSIGGAIHLGMNNYWVNGFKAEARIDFGSFDEELYGTKLFYGNGKLEGVTRVYYYKKKNNFPFFNTTHDFEKNGAFGEDVQRNASVENKGVIQEFNYKLNTNETFTLKAWIESDWHEIQQNMQTNAFQPNMRKTLSDDHVRLWTEYKNEKKKLHYKLGGGYVYDNSVHNHSTNKISTQRLIFNGDGEYKITNSSSFKGGVNFKSIFPKVYAYNTDLKREDWTDIHLSYYQNFFNKLTVSVNLRQAFVTDFDVPFTPAVGFSYNALAKEKYVLSFTGNVSKSYRVPTFNDRYWVPGGNPNLKPEDGINYELGSKFSYCIDGLSGTIKVNAFYLDVDNWLLWINGSNGWEADNVQRVVSKGIEAQSNWDIHVQKYTINTGLNYSYNPVERAEVVGSSSGQNKAIGRQLEYVPLHRGVFYLSGIYKDLSAGFDFNYTHKQYTSQEQNTIPAYTLVNLQSSYKYKVNDDHVFRFAASLNNILNKDYQSSEGYPMPRINGRLSVTYKFK
ncbi:TonB-dependent receptor [Carboxylicivirga sp. N1Y90]|uniref:TonB-dependent receptor n=1 Tax=Carboxylicivirga fragile TaxID=3417571 RepID=UPI003D33BF1E|nr:TonB-dependent receptor [Marinilabiliaceae bacterium N1Y90]